MIVPTITAKTKAEFAKSWAKLAPFATRIHVDISDGVFSPNVLVYDPAIIADNIGSIAIDFHVMSVDPMAVIGELSDLCPNLIIVHQEVSFEHRLISRLCHSRGVKLGLGVLKKTALEPLLNSIEYVDHVLIFGGTLGQQGARADLTQIERVKWLVKHMPSGVELAWDGGITLDNIAQLKQAGVTIFDVGASISNSENPELEYDKLNQLV